MKTRLYNGQILTLEKDFNIIQGEVWINDNIIEYIGEPKADMPVFDKELDTEGNLIMPTFKNAHAHSAMTFLRSYADDLPLESWLHDKVFPMEEQRKEGDCYAFARVALLEYIEGGISAFMDMYAFEEETVQAAVDLGIRVVSAGSLNDFTGSIKRETELYNSFNGKSPLVSKSLGFHAVYTTDEALLKELSDISHELKAPVYTHACETVAEVEGCLAKTGKTPVEYIDSLGLFDYGGGIYHGVYLSEREIEILKEKGIWVISCPASNLKLASGIAPLDKLSKAGISLALGTDGAASNNCLDMFREMYLATSLQKYLNMDATAMAAEKVLYMATVGSARAMRLYNCDVLAAGKDADLIVIDLNQPNMQPINHIVKNIVYSGSKKNIKMTMIRGNIVYLNGEFICQNKEKIFEEAIRKTTEIKGRCTK